MSEVTQEQWDTALEGAITRLTTDLKITRAVARPAARRIVSDMLGPSSATEHVHRIVALTGGPLVVRPARDATALTADVRLGDTAAVMERAPLRATAAAFTAVADALDARAPSAPTRPAEPAPAALEPDPEPLPLPEIPPDTEPDQ